MRRLIIIDDREPHVKHLLNHWEMTSARIEGDTLTANMRNKSKLTIEAVDPQMVADIVLSHDPSSEVVTGKMGITSVVYEEHEANSDDAKDQLVKALRTLLDELEE